MAVEDEADALQAEMREYAWDLVQALFMEQGLDMEADRDVLRIGVEAGMSGAMRVLLARGVI